MLLFGAAVQSSNRQYFVELAMTMSNSAQSEIKDILEPLLMKEGMNTPIIPDDYSEVLRTKLGEYTIDYPFVCRKESRVFFRDVSRTTNVPLPGEISCFIQF